MTAARQPSPPRRPLYRQVMDGIRDKVRDRRAGDRIATENEFAREFGVSLITVKQALRELEYEGLIERRHGSGTFVSPFKTARRHVALLLDADPAHPRISPYFPKLLQELRLEFNRRGVANRAYYGFGLPDNGHSHGALSCSDLLDDVRLGRVNGLVAFFTAREASWMEVMEAREVPVFDAELRWQLGWYDKKRFLHLALAHFREQGRRRLAVLASGNPLFPVQNAFYRELALLAPQYGLALDDRLVDLDASAWVTGMGWERLRDLWQRRGGKPDSLLLLSDLLFEDCQSAVAEIGIAVPRKLELMVYSSDAMTLRPRFPIRVYRVSTADSARCQVEALLALQRGETLPSPGAFQQGTLITLAPGEEEVPLATLSPLPKSADIALDAPAS